jgi:hypothetical protein
MSTEKVRCQRCGGDIFYDETEKCLKCFACARPLDKDGKPIPPTPAPPPDRYHREYHIPRSLRRKDDDGSLCRK